MEASTGALERENSFSAGEHVYVQLHRLGTSKLAVVAARSTDPLSQKHTYVCVFHSVVNMRPTPGEVEQAKKASPTFICLALRCPECS
jgi:hypothetical protein